ncbi:Acriflavin resistance protein [mine drainage metagenome]|uniref:Acriflavin resistance protein n=1 Tax=mine drainage metagenome TaxID=410659 RepID=T0Y6B2_9ZZZZ
MIAYRDGAAVRLGNVATVTHGVENVRTLGLFDGHRAVALIIRKKPDANVIATVDHIKALLPAIRASIPHGISVSVTHDETTSIRTSMHDVEITLLLAVLLVVTVVLVMLRNPRAALVPAVAVPLALIGTLAVIYLLGFSLNNFSMMALTVATGFVVDDAIVVIENITRHIEAGEPRLRAALDGGARSGFYRARHELLADRGVRAHLVDGRNGGTDFPPVRPDAGDHRGPLARDFPDDHPDAVRAGAAPAPASGAILPRRRAGVQPHARLLRPHARNCDPPPAAGDAGAGSGWWR